MMDTLYTQCDTCGEEAYFPAPGFPGRAECPYCKDGVLEEPPFDVEVKVSVGDI